MRPRVEPIRSWVFDQDGRPISYIKRRKWGYEVGQARRLGGRVGACYDPEDAEMMAAAWWREGRRRA